MPFLSKTAYPDRYEILKGFAKENRRNMTDAEKVLWNALRAIPGVRFRRQHPIGDYIADFLCMKSRLIVEVDGGYHSEPCQQEDDAVRTANIENLGYSVIRFPNEKVLNETQKVIEQIKNQLYNKQKSPHSTPFSF